MNVTLIKALALLAVAGALFGFTAYRHSRTKPVVSLLQLAGAGLWIVVALAHICEALALFPMMGWGREDSIGHYLDLSSALLGTGLLSVGLVLQVIKKHHG